jgi:hypothetical protein
MSLTPARRGVQIISVREIEEERRGRIVMDNVLTANGERAG